MDKSTIFVAIVAALIGGGAVVKISKKAPALAGLTLVVIILAGMFTAAALH